VIDTLAQEVDAAERGQRMRRALTLRLLWARALHADGQRSKAMRVLAQAVSFATTEGYVRAFLDEGRGVVNLLRELRATPWHTVASAGEPDPEAFLDKVLRGVTEETPAPGAPTGTAPGRMRLVVPLTRKEIQVLKLAAEGLSNDALAQRLFVAETTVRTHLRNIHVKLDVRNRVEAVAVARRLGLID
jgi:LuxR family maltose regulon positive regulatory protein